MLSRELVNVVLWPLSDNPMVLLINETDGEVWGEFPLRKPMRGDVLARMVPPNLSVALDGVSAVSLRGQIVTTTKSKFDTVVVTERAQLSMEERMDRMERIERRKTRRLEKELKEIRAERRREKARAGPPEPSQDQVDDKEPDATKKPPEVKEPHTVDDPQGAVETEKGEVNDA